MRRWPVVDWPGQPRTTRKDSRRERKWLEGAASRLRGRIRNYFSTILDYSASMGTRPDDSKKPAARALQRRQTLLAAWLDVLDPIVKTAPFGANPAAPDSPLQRGSCGRPYSQASEDGASLDPLVFGDRWIAVRSDLTRDTGMLPRARLPRLGNRVAPRIQYGLDREAHGYVSRAVENLKDLVADQTTEFAPGPLFGNEFNPAVAGVAFGAGDVGLLHFCNMCLRWDRSSRFRCLSASLGRRNRPATMRPGRAGGSRISD